MSETIGFIGLGHLGLPMATNLADAGHRLRVYNRTASKADSLVARGMQRATRPVDAVTTGGVVVSVLWDDAALESVVTSDGFLEQLGPGGVHVSMSTVLPATAQRLAALHARQGSLYLDAPVFGRPEAAAAKKLWIPIAGAPSAKERVRQLLEAMGAQGIFDFGEAVGAATVVKLAGNFLIGAAALSLIEALSMADKSGVDLKAVVAMLTATLFPAPIYQSYGKLVADKTAPFGQGEIARKDLGLFMRTADQVASPTPISSQLYSLVGGADPRRSAPATARNREPILGVLARVLPKAGLVLEVASGTGEHALFFAGKLPALQWQPSDPDEGNRASIAAWRDQAAPPNLRAPMALDATWERWPVEHADAMVNINMIHIAPWAACEGLMRGAGRVLPTGAPLVLYGPFRQGGRETAPSNEAFDRGLRERDATWGVRDLDEVVRAAAVEGLALDEVVEMPSNNLSVIFRRA